jgi:signal transduction histidine kinase
MRVGDRIANGWRRFATPRAPVATGAPGWRSPAWLQAAGTRGRALVPSRRWRALLLGPVVGGLWLVAYQQVLAWTGPVIPDRAASGLVTALATLPLLGRTRLPLTTWAAVTSGVAILAAAWPVLPLGAVVALLAALYTVGVRYSRLVALGAGVISTLALLLMLGNDYRAGVPVPMPLVVSLIVAALAVADQVSSRRLTEDALAEQVEQHRQEQARRAVLEERSRIARELHDVVAHHMSMVAVQAETAPYRIKDLPDDGLRDFAAIGETARAALVEMRRLLGVLRSDAGPEREPQPGLGHLAELVDGVRKAGLPVRLAVHGQPRPLPAGVELSAYRIVQEALRNAGRHARDASRVDVEVRFEPERLTVTVTDDGLLVAPPAGDEERSAPGERWGHGLLGMSERVTMLGGTLEAGPDPKGGFRVHAVMPVRPGAERDGDAEVSR